MSNDDLVLTYVIGNALVPAPVDNRIYWQKSNHDLSFSNGRVGIGTSQPSTVLEVFDHSNQAL